MNTGPTHDEKTLFDDISALLEKVWDISKDISGTMTDPKFISVVLFRRLRGSHRAYAVLWKNSCQI